MLDQQCQYFTSEQSHQYLCQRRENRLYPKQYRAKNKVLSQLLGRIEIKPMPFQIMSISNMGEVGYTDSDIIQENVKVLIDQENIQLPHNELFEKAKHCFNLLECSKEEIQDVEGLSLLFSQILQILQQSKQKNLFFITTHNLEDKNKQRKLIYNPEALTNLIKKLRSGKISRIQTQSIGKQIQKTELNEQLSVQALNLLKQLKKKQLNK